MGQEGPRRQSPRPIHVSYDAKGRAWTLQRHGEHPLLAQHATLEEAVEEAVRIASREQGEIVLHGRDGEVVQRASFSPVGVGGASEEPQDEPPRRWTAGP